MSQNSKNRLQEYCQSHDLDLPIYRIDDSYATSSGFRCISQITAKNGDKLTGYGIEQKIKSAEKRAALDILNKILEMHESEIQHISWPNLDGGYIAIYLDIENINVKELTQLFSTHKYDPTQFLFVGCLSTNHHYAETEFGSIEEFDGIAFEKVLVPSTRSDAADIGMIMHALKHHNKSGKSGTSGHHDTVADRLIFVSRDKFSCVFVELSKKGFCFNNDVTKVDHCSCVEDMKRYLQVESVKPLEY